VVLDEIDTVDLQPAQAVFQLARGLGVGAAVDLGHDEGLVPVAIAKRQPHPLFAEAFVVIPAVVQERHAPVDRLTHDADGERFVDVAQAQVPAPNPDRGNGFTGVAERAVEH